MSSRWFMFSVRTFGQRARNWSRRQAAQRAYQGQRRLVRQPLVIEEFEDRTVPSTWNPLGPAPIIHGQVPGNQPVSGRITALAADPTNPNVIYIGAAGGGVWKTTNGGASWTSLTGFVSIPFIGAIALAPSNPNIIYVGTGEGNQGCDCYYGVGILKSTDGGNTWTTLGSSYFFRHAISKILVDRTNPNIVYGGSQDNGTEEYTGSPPLGWNLVALGDGSMPKTASSPVTPAPSTSRAATAGRPCRPTTPSPRRTPGYIPSP
jgi:hypothetical protein